ncbi:hypothetical protein CPB86DRAFT_788590 [Serendipita vermifera]|nr:hypothetical protein CPB86DRAFT_788590 [Serendipita vermifera]
MSNDTTTSQSIIILSPSSQIFVDNVRMTIGPWLIGALGDLFLQGILTVQTANYFTHLSGEPYRKRTWLVIGLTILCILKSIQNILDVWGLTVEAFCDPDMASQLPWSKWQYYSAPLLTAIIAIIVQSFFVLRYWRLTKAWYICIPIIVGMILSIIGAVVIFALLASSPFSPDNETHSAATMLAVTKLLRRWTLIHLISSILVDVAITTATAWHLYKQKPFVARLTSEMIDRLIRMVWQSALPPTLCVILTAIVIPPNPTFPEYILMAPYGMLPKLYAISLMYTLNLGQEIKSSPNNTNGVSLHPRTSPEILSLCSPLPVGKDKVDLTEAQVSSESGGS